MRGHGWVSGRVTANVPLSRCGRRVSTARPHGFAPQTSIRTPSAQAQIAQTGAHRLRSCHRTAHPHGFAPQTAIRAGSAQAQIAQTGAHRIRGATAPPTPTDSPPKQQSAPVPHRRRSPKQAHIAYGVPPHSPPPRIRPPNSNPHPFRTGADRPNRRTSPTVAQQHNTRGSPGTECRVVAGPQRRV